MNILKFITLFATIISLSGCGATITAKNATGFIGGQLLSGVTESDDVIVADMRVNKTKNWNTTPVTQTSTTASATADGTQQIHTPMPVTDKSETLLWFFFAMMLMGMLGAGIIGMIEAFSGRDSLSTKQAERTAPIIKKPKPKVKPKARKTK